MIPVRIAAFTAPAHHLLRLLLLGLLLWPAGAARAGAADRGRAYLQRSAQVGATGRLARLAAGIRAISGLSLPSQTVYAGSNDRYVYALDAHTGNTRWRFRTGNRVVSSPAVG